MKFESLKEKVVFYNISIVLFSLIPLFLITGPFLSDLAISLISILFLIYCIRKKNFSYFKNKYFYFFLIFWVYLIFNSLINNFNFDSIKISFFYFRYGVFVIAIVALLDVNNNFIKYFFYCMFICFLILIFDGYYQYFAGENIFGWKKTHRISSFFGDEYILGSYLSRLWPVFFGLSILIFKQKEKLFYLLILTFILTEALIFISGDRSAFFYVNLSAIFVILFSKKLFKLRLVTLLSSILLLIIISLINPAAKERVFDQTLDQMNLVKNDEKKQQVYIFTQHHHEIYIAAYKIFLDNKILGVGVKNFRKFCNNEKYFVNGKKICSTHPHNSYIQILTETGLIGFLFLLLALFYFCKFIFIHLKEKFSGKYYFSDFEICILSGIVIYLWPIVPTGSVFNNWTNIALILNFPFLMWSKSYTKTNNF